MATFYFDIKSLSRKDKQSARAHVMYIARDGQYARGRPGEERDRCLWVESVNVPGWGREGTESDYRSARRFWDAADTHSRSNARLAVKVTLAMPVELSVDQQLALARAYIAQATTLRDGQSKIPATWALHEGRGINPHVHACLAETVVDEYPRSADTWFRRAANPDKPPESGGARRTREIHGEWVDEQRKAWEALANLALERAGVEARIDCRSLADRGSEDVPAEKVSYGPQASARLARNQQRKSINAHVRSLRAEAAQITTSQAGLAQPETPQNDHRPDQRRAAGRPGLSVPGLDAPVDADRLAAGAAPGHAVPAGSNDVGLAGSRPGFIARALDPRAGDVARADAAAGRAAPAREPGVRERLPGSSLDGRKLDPSGVVRHNPHHLLEPRGSDGHHGLRRQGASPAGEGGWRLEPAQPATSKLYFAKPGRELIEAQRAIHEWAQGFAERMQAFAARVDAAKVAKSAAKAVGAGGVPTLSKTPTLASLTATSLRAIDKLSSRDLAEQWQIAEKGVASMHEQWRDALNARDPQWAAACRAQHAARRARVKALQGEIARRAAVAQLAPAELSQAPNHQKEMTLREVTVEGLREQAQISASAMHEAARLALAGGQVGRDAADRLKAATARSKMIHAELAERERAQASNAQEQPAPAPIEAPQTVLAVRDELDLASTEFVETTANAKRAVWVVARRDEIERAWLNLDKAKAAQAKASTARAKASADAARAAAFAKLKDVAMTARSGRLDVPPLGQPGTRQFNLQALAEAREAAAAAEARREAAGQKVQQLRAAPEAAARAETPPMPAPVVARDAQSQAEAMRAVVNAARRRQAELAARDVGQQPDESEERKRSDFDVPGRRRRT